MIKQLQEFIKSRLFLINLASLLTLLTGLLIVVYFWLDSYTLHGEYIEVPALLGKQTNEIASTLKAKNLRYEVVDSSVFDLSKPKGSILEQDPLPHTKVKENRTIYLGINASHPPLVKMPNLLDVSDRQAKAILESYGLVTGQIEYKPHYARNAVLEQRYKGHPIPSGTSLQRGSVIDLVLGDGLGADKIPLPSLIGITLDQARQILKDAHLSEGAVIKDGTVHDSLQAKIWKQLPHFSPEALINQGDAIDLFITQDAGKIPADTLLTNTPDE